MLDYGQLAINPYHLNRNQEEEEGTGTDYTGVQQEDVWNWSDWSEEAKPLDWFGGALKIGGDLYGDYMQYGDLDEGALDEMENPLMQSYENLMNMGKQYQDPHSALSTQLQDSIRTKDLSDFSDVAKRERMMATGEYGAGQQRMDDKMMSSAIGKALGNFSDDYAKRLQTGTNLTYQAGAIGQQLANLRKDRFLAQKERRKQQGMKVKDYAQEAFDFFVQDREK